MISKIKDWLKQKGAQFEVVSRHKEGLEITGIKRIKDNAIFKKDHPITVDISSITDYADAWFNPLCFEEDLIHIKYSIVIGRHDGNIEVLNGLVEADSIKFSKNGSKILYVNSKNEERHVYTQIDSYTIPK